MEPPSRLGADLRDIVARSGFGLAAIGDALTLLRPMLWPFVVGSILAATLCGVIAYRVMLLVLRASRPPDPQTAPPAES